MNRRPGHVKVTTETGFCGFCGRPRNLRREEHQLGTLVRTIVTCETCHRTLSSEIGVAQPEPVAAPAPVPETVEKVEKVEKVEAPLKAKTPATPKRATAKRATTTPRKSTRTK